MKKRHKKILNQILNGTTYQAHVNVKHTHKGMWRNGKAKPQCKAKSTRRVML